MKLSKRQKDYLIITIVIFLFVLLTYRFKYVFGSDTDWVNQHTIIPDYFRQIFYKTGNLLPNMAFHYGAGQNIFNISYYGLLSPITLLSYFFPFLSMATYTKIINIIILIVSGILFYRFMESHGNDRKMCLLTSVIFILGAPFIFHMHRHTMFVNYMPFLLLGFFGVDKYLNKKKKTLLIISVFLMIMTSYYYSVVGIIVLCIYYVHEYLYYHKTAPFKETMIDVIKFGLTLLVAVMLAGIILVPTMYTIFMGRNEGGEVFKLSKLLIPDIRFYDAFNGTYSIGLSVTGFITLLYLFFTKKRSNVIVAIIISTILFVPVFKYVLNGGLYIRAKCFIPFLPLFSYYISFFLKDLFDKKINIKWFVIYLLIIWIPLYYSNRIMWFYGLFLLFIIGLLLYKKYNKKIFVIAVILGILIGTNIYETFKEDELSFEKYDEYFSSEVADSINSINSEDKGFYRTANLHIPNKTVNVIYNDNYYTTNIYSSTYNGDYLNFIRDEMVSNMPEYNNFLIPSKSNLLWNSFMGVKYVYSPYKLGYGYTEVRNNVYKNNHVLPLIYARSNILGEADYNRFAYPYNEELLLNNVIVDDKSSNPYINFSISKAKLKYEIKDAIGIDARKMGDSYNLLVNDEGEFTVVIKSDISNKLLLVNISSIIENTCKIPNISIKINQEENIRTCKTWPYDNKNKTFHYIFGDNDNELKVKLLKGFYHIEGIETYLIDYQKIFNTSYDEMNITKMSDDTILGDIKVSKDGYLVTSIPYDVGFKMYIDDTEVEVTKVNKAFIGAKISKGEHNIKITYHSPWLNYGLIISGIGLLSLIGIIIFDNRKKKEIS